MRSNAPARIAWLALLAPLCPLANAQLNIAQVGHLDYHDLHTSDLSNVWGYVDEEGNEYALVGVNGDAGGTTPGGFSVVDVTDPANPVEIFFTPGPNSIWREIKTWGDYAYITTEADGGGLMIVDLSPLPQSTDLPVTVFQGNGWLTSHSLFIDENGRLYLNGANRGNGGVIFYDLTQDPMAPVEVGQFDTLYVHDCFARDNILYTANIFEGLFSIVDVHDPASPHALGLMGTPTAFTHNCWLDDTGQYLFTTDEKPDSYLAAYDVSDPTDIQFLDKLQTDPGSDAIIHNTYWLNGYTVQSYYTEGISIYDVNDPANIVEVGRYDTSPFSGEGFNGAWGVYPFLPSGNLLVSDIQQGLFILAPTYVQACRLEGLITDASTSLPLDQATITIDGTTAFDVTDNFDGQYSTGWAVPGTYNVTVSAVGYVSQTVQGVLLTNGQITLLDVQLQPDIPFDMVFTVREQGSNTPVQGAQVTLASVALQGAWTTDANGQFIIAGFFAGSYDITAAHWGHVGVCQPSQFIGTSGYTLMLDPGYADDFQFDLGWSATGNAGSGHWTRDVPLATFDNGDPVAPGSDAEADCGELAYVTGNGGGQPGTDDVDDGYVQLRSPVFDASGMSDPWVRYDRWWFTGGGNSTSNDSLVVQLDNGNSIVTVEVLDVDYPEMAQWVPVQLQVSSFIAPTADMRLIVRTADNAPGHWVEAGLDRFEVLPESPFLVMPDRVDITDLSVFPDPSDGAFTVLFPGISGRVSIFDVVGEEVLAPTRLVSGRLTLDLDVPSGIYVVRVLPDEGSMRSARIIIR